jgi:hypothetical protein
LVLILRHTRTPSEQYIGKIFPFKTIEAPYGIRSDRRQLSGLYGGRLA